MRGSISCTKLRAGPGPIIEAACWAHARRKFFDLARINKAPIAIEAIERMDALFAIERDINGKPPAEPIAAMVGRAAHKLRSDRGHTGHVSDIVDPPLVTLSCRRLCIAAIRDNVEKCNSEKQSPSAAIVSNIPDPAAEAGRSAQRKRPTSHYDATVSAVSAAARCFRSTF
jgi:hypothetical protein